MKVISHVFTWIFRLCYVNILYLLGTAIGLIVFGFVPSTIALFSVVRRWKRGEKNFTITRYFIKEYRDNFAKTSFLGIPILLIGYILLAEINIFWQQASNLYYILSVIVIITFTIFISMLLYYFPIYSHYEFTFIKYIQMSFIMAIIHPIRTIGMLLLLVVFYFLFLMTPLIFTLIGFSIMALVITHLVYDKFPYTDYEEQIK